MILSESFNLQKQDLRGLSLSCIQLKEIVQPHLFASVTILAVIDVNPITTKLVSDRRDCRCSYPKPSCEAEKAPERPESITSLQVATGAKMCRL